MLDAHTGTHTADGTAWTPTSAKLPTAQHSGLTQTTTAVPEGAVAFSGEHGGSPTPLDESCMDYTRLLGLDAQSSVPYRDNSTLSRPEFPGVRGGWTTLPAGLCPFLNLTSQEDSLGLLPK